MEGPRYETRSTLPHTKRPCTGCGGFRWSAKGECLNEPCISEETRARIFSKPTKRKGRS